MKSPAHRRRQRSTPTPKVVTVIKNPKTEATTWRLGYLPLPIIGVYSLLSRLRKLLPMPALLRHTYVVGKSGAGKSELLKLLLLRLVLRRRWYKWWWQVDERVTVFFLDPHGEAAEQMAKNRLLHQRFRHSGAAPKLVYLDFCGGKQGTPTVNPFELPSRNMNPEAPGKRAENLSLVFAHMLSRGNSALTLPMFTVLRAMIQVLLAKSMREGIPATFFDLERFLRPERSADLLNFGCQEMPTASIRHFFQYEFLHSRFGATRFSLQIKLACLLHSAAFRRILCQRYSTFRPEKFFRSGNLVIINAAQTALGAEVTEILGRTVVTLLQMIAIERGVMKGFRPTFLILDEANTFLSPAISALLEQLRKYGLHLLMANQHIAQSNMTPQVTRTLLGNTYVRLCGIAGKQTRQQIAAECQVPGECLEGLRTGEFFLGVEGHAPVRIKVPKFFLGTKRQVSLRQWQHFLLGQRRRWYHLPGPSEHLRSNETAAQLAEEIEAAKGGSAALRNPDLCSRSPRPVLSTSSQ